MHERPEDLERLQALLDRSYATAGGHLLSIHEPKRRLTAAQIVERLDGMILLTLATSTRDGRPLAGPVDGFFIRGELYFGSSPDSLRFQHIAERPHVSATHLPGEHLGVTVHGRARVVDLDAEDDDGQAATLRQVCLENYGPGWADWGDAAAYAHIEADRMFVFHLDLDETDD